MSIDYDSAYVNEFISSLLSDGTSEQDIDKLLNDMINGSAINDSDYKYKSEDYLCKLWETAEKEILPMMCSYPSIRIKININGHTYHALLDTGAQSNIISKNIIEECNLQNSVDYECKGIAKGIGESSIIGCIPYFNITFENFECACNFKVIDSNNIDIILGQSFMMFYKVKLDFENNLLTIADNIIPMIIIDH